jgi:hypothetical protein
MTSRTALCLGKKLELELELELVHRSPFAVRRSGFGIWSSGFTVWRSLGAAGSVKRR